LIINISKGDIVVILSRPTPSLGPTSSATLVVATTACSVAFCSS